MKLAVLLSRHRRLLALCGMSAAVHLLVLEFAARHGGPPPAALPMGEALRLRLAPAAPAATAPAQAATAARKPVRARARGLAGLAAPVPPAPAAKAAPAPLAAAAATPAAAPPDATGAPEVEGAGSYRVRMPDPVRLEYAVRRQAPGSPPAAAGKATLAWTTDGERYALAVDGVLGRLDSEGGSGDAGIVPLRAVEQHGGEQLVTEFDRQARRIVFHATGASVPDAADVQDRASVLMQLAGIGLAEPDQIAAQRDDDLRIVVAGADGAGIVRYRVMGQEVVETALGGIQAWRLAQVTPAGQERIELWLAPDRGWLPVQLRMTRADGSVLTQTLTRIEPGPAR